MKVFLFEHIDEVKSALSQYGKEFLINDNTRVVSLIPKVELFLKAEGIACENTTAYFTTESHKQVVERTEEIIQVILPKIDLKDEIGLSGTYNHFLIFHLRFYLNYFLSNIEILENIHAKNDIKEIHIPRGSYSFSKGAYIDRHNECFLSEIVRRFSKGKKINVKEIAFKLRKNVNLLSMALEHVVTIFAKIYFTIYALIIMRTIKKDEKFLIVPTWGYNFDGIIYEIRKQQKDTKTAMITFDDSSYKRKLRLMMMSLSDIIPLFKKLFK